MNKSNLETLIYNLSAVKYQFAIVCETALSQLNHYFCTIGNGVEYDSIHGLMDADYSGNYFYITAPHIFDFSPVLARRQLSSDELQKSFESMKEIFGENVPAEMKSLYEEQIENVSKPFKVMDESYFFNYNDMAVEMIESVRNRYAKSRKAGLQIETPYMINYQYSIIYKMKSTDNPLMVKLALAMCKAWIVVLEYYVEAGLYFTEEDVQKYQGESYLYSLNYINTCIDKFKNIIQNLENHHD